MSWAFDQFQQDTMGLARVQECDPRPMGSRAWDLIDGAHP